MSIDDSLHLDNQICFPLYAAANAMVRLYRPLLDVLGLTYPQYLALLVLWEEDGRSVGELGKLLRLDSGTLTPLLKRLEAAGLVARQRDPADERRVVITLTAAGRKLKTRAREVPGKLLCEVPLPLGELVELRSRLNTLMAALENPDK
ncbi:MAG: MarR family transcriptional regulator [Sulfuritalea sp.]|nr:MarR family transcriptional regulator [Sulfuritalea sp.]MDP1984207.1 MarR family transcriptional regulator [Sulfuritalea sp.]